MWLQSIWCWKTNGSWKGKYCCDINKVVENNLIPELAQTLLQMFQLQQTSWQFPCEWWCRWGNILQELSQWKVWYDWVWIWPWSWDSPLCKISLSSNKYLSLTTVQDGHSSSSIPYSADTAFILPWVESILLTKAQILVLLVFITISVSQIHWTIIDESSVLFYLLKKNTIMEK